MQLYRSILFLFVTLQFLDLSRCGPTNQVHHGIILTKALHEASRLCPKKITHKRKAEIATRIKKLIQPALSASDPHRNEYGLHDFVPTSEEIQTEAASLCGFSSMSMESLETIREGSDAYLIPSEEISHDEDDSEDVHGNSVKFIQGSFVDKISFLLGLLSGMLVVFAYLYFKSPSASSPQAQGTKSLRRPEL